MDLTHIRFDGTPVLPAGRRGGLTNRAIASPDGEVHAGPVVVTGLPAWILEQAGLDPAAYRHAPLRRRLSACLRAIRAESEQDAYERLAARPDLHHTAVNQLLIGVSEFFRDPAVFRALEETVLPVLAKTARPLRILSVGCSTGDELYSMAIALGEAGLLDGARLVGVDCREDAVVAARRGVFSEAACANVDPGTIARYFERAAEGWRVIEPLRQRTQWLVLDATHECPAGPWDVIFCRNLVIYLSNRTAETLFRTVAGQLTPGGVLVVGKAERPAASLRLRQLARCVYTTIDVN